MMPMRNHERQLRQMRQMSGFSFGVFQSDVRPQSTSPSQSISRPEKSVQVSAEIPADLQKLSDDFSRLLEQEINPDVTLTCGDRMWRVHKSVLAVRSEVFATMFRSRMAEKETDLVSVEDLEASVLDSLLKYIYSGKVPNITGENVLTLYTSGEKYALYGVRKACSNWMVGNMSSENCLNILLVADAHSDAELKEAVVSFIVEHPALFECTSWINFVKECPILGVEVLQRFALSMKNCASNIDYIVLNE